MMAMRRYVDPLWGWRDVDERKDDVEKCQKKAGVVEKRQDLRTGGVICGRESRRVEEARMKIRDAIDRRDETVIR